MRNRAGSAGSGRPWAAVALTLVAGGTLAWVGFRALMERERSVETHYTATTVLVRDRVIAEVARLETGLGAEFALVAPELHDAASARAWLARLPAERPWLDDPILVADTGAILSLDLRTAWPAPDAPAAMPPGFTSLLAQAERAEFGAGTLRGALHDYRRANAGSPSLSARVLTHMRIGRVLFKLGERAAGIDEYRTAVRLAGDLTDPHGTPYAVGALRQIADGLATLQRTSERRLAERELRDYVISHPWNTDAGYEYHLAYALSLGGDVESANDASVRRLRERLARLAWVRRDVAPIVTADLRGARHEVTVERAGIRRGDDETIVSWITVPGPATPALGLAYELRMPYVAGALLDQVLGTVDLGGDLYVAVLEGGREHRATTPGAARVALAEAALDGLPGWRVGLFHRGGRSMQQLVARERVIYGTLIGAMILVLVAGISFTARASAREAQLARLRTEFVASVSHELKTPLALIRLFGETLDSGIVTEDERRREFYGVIRRESERLTHLIENVLDIARIEAGTKQYAFEAADINAIARDALDAYRPFLERQGFDVEVALSDAPCRLRVDRDAVVRALINLFQNAIKYSGDVRHVTISSAVSDGGFRLSVADRGIGIAPADLPRIFDRYYRAHADGGGVSAGSGLGLSLVAHAMAAHGGRVDVESTPGAGSVFTLVFPLGPAGGERQVV